jgi:D-tagatose-1,6-bisphosphate aldolase subunit GatZ/KbaZ
VLLEEVVAAQKRGEKRGITSICSAHSWVINAAMHCHDEVLIEATCNQVNQFGGYTGMTPAKFITFVRGLAKLNAFPIDKISLGGDHLGPNVWQDEPAAIAMQKSEVLIKDYVKAGFTKIHVDCSMRLGDDPAGPLDPRVSALRTAQLVKVAERVFDKGSKPPLFVIGTEVPIPGGAIAGDKNIHVTDVVDIRQTIEDTQKEFKREGLDSAWERVIAVVVQPGVEFGDDYVVRYDRGLAKHLVQFIETQPLIYEAHSTDYQSRTDLSDLVEDHFGILKVGPALTFAFREAVFTLAKIEDELIPEDSRSNLITVIDDEMLRDPKYWKKYYTGDDNETAMARKFGLTDRIRYYWSSTIVQESFRILLQNLSYKSISSTILRQHGVTQADGILKGRTLLNPQSFIYNRICEVFEDYKVACG